MRLPPLNALRAFEAAARHGGFIGAADELCVTRGAVSRHVKLLEEHLGVMLFRRLPNGIELTEQGRQFLPILSAAFSDIAVGVKSVASQKQALRVVCPPTISIKWLIPRLDQFRITHPEIRVSLTTEFLKWAEFEAGDFDLGFCNEHAYARPVEAKVIPLLPMIIMPACSPRLLEAHGPLRNPECLSKFTLLHEAAHRHDWSCWLRTFGVKGVDPNSGDVFPNLDMAAKAAVMGKGIVMADLLLNRDELETGLIVPPFKDLCCETDWGEFCLLGPAHRWNDPRVKAFRSWILGVAAEDAKELSLSAHCARRQN